MKTKLGKYLTLDASFENTLKYFDDKIAELAQMEKEADNFEEAYMRVSFKTAYRNLIVSYKKQRDIVAQQIGKKK